MNQVLETVSQAKLFINAFDPNLERDPRLVNIKDSMEFRDFILGICKKSTLKKYFTGDFICHKGDLGTEMYIIQEGRVGVYIEKNYTEVEAQNDNLEYLCKTIVLNSKTKYDDKTALQGWPEELVYFS